MKKLFCLLLAVALLAGCSAAVPAATEPTIPGLPFNTPVGEPVKYGRVADVYIPQTKLVNPPTVVQYVNSATGLPQPDKTPAVCILPIDQQLRVVDKDRVLISAQDFLALYRNCIIPAFLIDSEEEADALVGFLREQKLTDAYVLAAEKDAHLVRTVRETQQVIQGGLLMDEITNRRDALILANNSLAAVICTKQAMSAEDMQWFNSRLLSVWCEADSDLGYYTAAVSGWNGIICPIPSQVCEFYERFTQTTACGKSIPIGHRGVYGQLENTIPSFRSAMEEHGCTAVELDLRLSKDGHIVIMHDGTVDRTTNGTGMVKDLTLEELKALDVTIGNSNDTAKIPTFREVLEAFAGTGLVLACHINVQNDIMNRQFTALVEEFQCQDQIIAFIGYAGIYKCNYRSYPAGIGYAAGTEETLLDDVSDLSVLHNFQRNLLPNHMQPLFYSYNVGTDPVIIHGKPEFYYAMCARGYLNWHSTTTGNITVDNALLCKNGAAGALLNDLTITDNYFYYLQAEDLTLKAGQALPDHCLAIGQTANKELPCEYRLLDGTPLDAATLVPGTVTAVAVATLKTSSSLSYQILSTPFTITVE
jgi:glycerophosphoryl diester phosphodiesterase